MTPEPEKHNPAASGLVHDYDCTHDPCRCDGTACPTCGDYGAIHGAPWGFTGEHPTGEVACPDCTKPPRPPFGPRNVPADSCDVCGIEVELEEPGEPTTCPPCRGEALLWDA